MSYRIDRVNEIIKNELSTVIMREIKDPRVQDTIIGVTRVHTTPDMKYCKVYVSIYGDGDKRRSVMDGLENAKGFLRKAVAAVLTTRYAPELIFVLDDSADNAMHIEELLRKANANESKPE